jgi:hypothetical protein
MTGIAQNSTQWPLVVFTYTGNYSEADVVTHLQGFEQLVRAGRRCALVFQLTGSRVFSAKERSLFAQFVRAHSTALKQVCAVAGVVTTNPLHNGVLTAVAWVVPMPCPVKVFSRIQDAESWALGHLALTGHATDS